MRGVVSEGGVAVLTDVPIPIPREGQLLIRVQTCAVNRLDLLQAAGKNPSPKDAGPVLGVEVVALVSGGGYSEFCISDERTAWRNRWPDLGLGQLSAIPEAMMTAYQLLFLVGNFQRGETVLMHAAASSIGQALIQMCVRKGVRVYATCRSADKAALCLQLGATECLVLGEGGGSGFAERVKALTRNQAGVHCVFCPVGNAYFHENVESLAVDGRYILYGTLSGASEELGGAVLGKLLGKRIALLASTLRTRSPDYKADLAAAVAADEECGLSAIGEAEGNIKILVDEVFALEDFAEAHEKMAANRNMGKLALTVTETANAIEFFRRELSEVVDRYKDK